MSLPVVSVLQPELSAMVSKFAVSLSYGEILVGTTQTTTRIQPDNIKIRHDAD